MTYKLMLGMFGLCAAQVAFGLTNDDVIKLKNAGLPEETIIAAVRKETREYDTSADGLIALKKAGVSDAVIQEILKPAAPVSVAVTADTPLSDEAKSFAKAKSVIAPVSKPVAGGTYFTRVNFYQEEDLSYGTNYAVGSLVPVNTAVTVVSLKGDRLVLKVDAMGQKITVENIAKHTKKSGAEVASLLLSEKKTDLDALPKPLAAAITSGTLRRGMTKEQVLLTRGYPPSHKTPSLEGDSWLFWRNRFASDAVVFRDGVVVEAKGAE